MRHEADSSMPDLESTLDEYPHFKDLHARTVSDYFENLVRTSGVDEAENARLVAELRGLEKAAAAAKKSLNGWRVALVTGIVIIIAATVTAFSVRGAAYLLLIVTVAVAVVLLSKVRSELTSKASLRRTLETGRETKLAEAWAQMAPLNRLHTWGVAAQLFQDAFPNVVMDRYVSSDRLDDFVSCYDLWPDLGDNFSTIFAQSGAFKGNPLIVARYLQHWIDQKRYTGSLVIHWQERVRNPQGEWVNESRSQTLTAYVTKPFPRFEESTTLFYGHEAAPHLSFSRRPSNLSGAGEGGFKDWRRNRKVKKVERMARRGVSTGTGGLTVMSNKDFEALFHATDRDHEIEFRLLFTPLAQQEMVKLLNDRTIGYGDDFAITKLGKVNLVETTHLAQTRLDADPSLFLAYDLSEARRFFNSFHASYFKALYFGLAPLLTVPLYRDARSTPGPASRPLRHESCSWEHESMAHLLGETEFRHPESITRNLLKTTAVKVNDSVHAVSVTALGYRGIDRVDYVSVRGGDGHMHSVPVPWIEYIPVQAQRRMLVGVLDSGGSGQDIDAALEQNWTAALHMSGTSATTSRSRGSLAACLLA